MSRYRHEEKYLLNACEEGLLRLRAGAVLKRDPYARTDGSYLIRSVYFDDDADACLRENLDGTDPRSKFRIRYYNGDAGHLQLEKKSKKRGLCLKESCALTREECELFLRGRVPPLRKEEEEIRKALYTEIRLRNLKPVAIITYERIPFVYPGGNVRVTFDRKLTVSGERGRFLTGDYRQRPVLPPGQSLMEVKWDAVLSGHIQEALQLPNLQRTAFSKYAMCRLTGKE